MENLSRPPYSSQKTEHAYVFGNLIVWRTVLGWRYPEARRLTTLVHEMRRWAVEAFRVFYGLVTLCVSVGQDESTLVEWIG